VTINGIGERAGNASLEEVSSCASHIIFRENVLVILCADIP
jgi:isopropylmalate/homocitrate/citramalate synthase